RFPRSANRALRPIRSPPASSYFLFDDPVPLSTTPVADRTRRAVFSLPRGAPPDEAGGQTSDRTASQHEHVVDDQPEGVWDGRSQRSHRTDGPGELRHHDKADSHDDPVPGGAPDGSNQPGQEPSGQQRGEGKQPLRDQLAAVTPEEQRASHRRNPTAETQARPAG